MELRSGAPGDDLWGSFAMDPRQPAFANLRASDQDREVLRALLVTAYADGRLDREEFDERSDRVTSARLLGDLPAIVDDLVLTAPATAPGNARTLVPSDDLVAQARRRYESDRREALVGFLGPSLLCVAIYLATMPGGFFWPAFVIAGTGINLLQTLVRRQDIVDRHLRRLEKKQAKEPGAKELEAGPAAADDEPEEPR